MKRRAVPFLASYALSRQVENVEPSIPHQSKVGARSYSDTRVDEWRILDGKVFEPFCDVLEHFVWEKKKFRELLGILACVA